MHPRSSTEYNDIGGVTGPSKFLSLLVNRASMAGFIVFDCARLDLFSGANIGKLVLGFASTLL